MIGRPTVRSKKLEDEICQRLADGETLLGMCRDNDHLPARSTVSLWISQDIIFSDRVARAREAGSHILIEETRHIADDGHNDYMAKRLAGGAETAGEVGYVLNGEHVQRSKLRIEQRWREAEAILPKVYGKQQTVTHAGSIGVEITKAQDDELVAEIMELLVTGRLKLPAGIMVVDDGAEDDDDDDIAGPRIDEDEDDIA